jgi:hypothetical protein
MQQKPAHPESDMIACEICLKEIPRDLAKSGESAEYVHYFCGDSCYARWQGEQGLGTQDTPGRG